MQGGVLAEECALPLQDFFRSRRRRGGVATGSNRSLVDGNGCRAAKPIGVGIDGHAASINSVYLDSEAISPGGVGVGSNELTRTDLGAGLVLQEDVVGGGIEDDDVAAVIGLKADVWLPEGHDSSSAAVTNAHVVASVV